MLIAIAIVLAAIDFIALAFLIYLMRKKVDHTHLISEVTEERRFLTDLRDSIHEELTQVQERCRDILKKVSTIAAEAEQEVRNGSATLAQDLEGLAERLAARFEKPLRELASQRNSIEALNKKIDRERGLLNKSIDRAEKLSIALGTARNYDDIVEDFKNRKYADARSMIAKGFQVDSIAKELGLTAAEVKMIAGTI